MNGFLGRLKARIVGRLDSQGQAGGARAERAAARFLQTRGLTILARNYRIRGGELDLICRDGATVVFVEVRMRQRADFGGAAASITRAKRRRLTLTARHWLAGQRDGLASAPCRFDVILLNAPEDPAPQWLRHAFDADASV